MGGVSVRVKAQADRARRLCKGASSTSNAPGTRPTGSCSASGHARCPRSWAWRGSGLLTGAVVGTAVVAVAAGAVDGDDCCGGPFSSATGGGALGAAAAMASGHPGRPNRLRCGRAGCGSG